MTTTTPLDSLPHLVTHSAQETESGINSEMAQ